MPRALVLSAVVPLALATAACAARGPAARASTPSSSQPSAIVAEQEARRQDFEWGSLYTYYDKETYTTRDVLAAVAVIKPGWEIHPPHTHAEEEYLMVVEGSGTWHLNGRDRPARTGDMQYAAPWDVHGIKNTGSTPLRFVVWKWNGKGVPPMARPR